MMESIDTEKADLSPFGKSIFVRSLQDLYQTQLEVREIANEPERVECRRDSWANLLTRIGKVNLFAGINRNSLDRISSENASSGSHQPVDVHAESRIDNFVGRYRSLPFQVRAKLENWAIDPEELLLQSSRKSRTLISSDGRGKAMYHGLEVDVKFLRASNEEDSSAHNEIQALAQMRHPNIVGFLGTCALGQLRLIVTESMSHGTLESLVSAQRAKCPSWRPAKADALAWSLDLVRAVNYMHQSDPCIVHRNLSPEALMVGPGGVLKVSGFESCSLAGAPVGPPRTPRPGPPSPYAAPELGAGRVDSDPAVDIFAVGMLMHFMRAGELLPSQGHLLHAAPSQPPSPLPFARPRPGTPAAAQLAWPEYTAAAARAAAADPAGRPTADELTGQLEGLQEGRERRLKRGSPPAGGCSAS